VNCWLVSQSWKRPERLRNIRLNIKTRTYASRLHAPQVGNGSIHGEKRFFLKPGLSHFGREQAASKTTKVLAQPARGSRETLFFSFYLFILLINSIQFY
jgi:hypothetical protein